MRFPRPTASAQSGAGSATLPLPLTHVTGRRALPWVNRIGLLITTYMSGRAGRTVRRTGASAPEPLRAAAPAVVVRRDDHRDRLSCWGLTSPRLDRAVDFCGELLGDLFDLGVACSLELVAEFLELGAAGHQRRQLF